MLRDDRAIPNQRSEELDFVVHSSLGFLRDNAQQNLQQQQPLLL